MTTDAGAHHFQMIHRRLRHRRPARGKFLVALLARIAGCDMRGMLAAGGIAVVATDAIAGNRGMIDYRQWNPGNDIMATIAIQIGDDMGRRFTGSNNAIMTIETDAQHLRMIDRVGRDWFPRHRTGLMTGLADVTAINMSGQLATGDHAVMTIDTGSDYLRVIHCRCRDRFPWRWTHGVTRLALVTAANMISKLARRGHAIMAANTRANNLCMINTVWR